MWVGDSAQKGPFRRVERILRVERRRHGIILKKVVSFDSYNQAD